MLRMISGEWRRRPLRAPKGDTTRPSADRTRETLFSMLASRLGSFEGLQVADLFAGSGALGLEALSRGAAHCLFVEQEPEAIRTIRANIAALQCADRCDVRAASVLALGPSRKPLDLILLDPPYGTGAGSVALDRLARLGWVSPATWIALEVGMGEKVDIKALDIDVMRKVGKAQLVLLRLRPETTPAIEPD